MPRKKTTIKIEVTLDVVNRRLTLSKGAAVAKEYGLPSGEAPDKLMGAVMNVIDYAVGQVESEAGLKATAFSGRFEEPSQEHRMIKR